MKYFKTKVSQILEFFRERKLAKLKADYLRSLRLSHMITFNTKATCHMKNRHRGKRFGETADNCFQFEARKY